MGDLVESVKWLAQFKQSYLLGTVPAELTSTFFLHLDVVLDALTVPELTPDPNYKPGIAYDFDGVVHQYVTPWTRADVIHDGPVDGAIEHMEAAHEAGFRIFIYTARANNPSAIHYIKSWLLRHGMKKDVAAVIHITALKPGAILYIDDRGFRFEGKFPTLDEIRSLKQWNRREHE